MIKNWGTTRDGHNVQQVMLTNGKLSASIITYGASVQDMRLAGHKPSLVLGLNTLSDYEAHGLYFGAIVGRCANRISGGKFTLDGQAYDLVRPVDQVHPLHGGPEGFFSKIWEVEAYDEKSVTLKLFSADGDMGYPGNLTARCIYSLSDDDALEITLEARTDAPTMCNLVNHTYFNLEDGGANNVSLHKLRLDAAHYLPTDETVAPTGHVVEVGGTSFDFRKLRPIGAFESYDHNFCLAYQRRSLTEVARLCAPNSGVTMDVFTTETGIQFYGGTFIEPLTGLDGIAYGAGSALCLEAQVWPDAINHDGFPNAVLRPDETLVQKTVYRFSTGL